MTPKTRLVMRTGACSTALDSFAFRIRVLLPCALLAMAQSVSAQRVTVQGHVIERGTITRIAGSTVELSGVGSTLTDRNGLFAFRGVAHGSYTLTLRALGYQPHQLIVDVQADTLLTIELDVTPVPLDSIVVERKTYTLRGRVDDQVTGLPLYDADVRAGSQRVSTNVAGSFRVRRLPAGAPTPVSIEVPGYLPVRMEILAQRDTTIQIRLVEDPIGQRMLDTQIERLTRRSSTLPYSRLQIGRVRLASSPSAHMLDYLKTIGIRKVPSCVLLDDVERPFPQELLQSYLPNEFERIEVIDKGTMLRLYTRRYVARLAGKERLPSVLLVKGMPRGPHCL